jgi:hypothetical protein
MDLSRGVVDCFFVDVSAPTGSGQRASVLSGKKFWVMGEFVRHS